MRADQRRSLHRTILTAAVLLLSASRTTRVRVRKKIKKNKKQNKTHASPSLLKFPEHRRECSFLSVTTDRSLTPELRAEVTRFLQ